MNMKTYTFQTKSTTAQSRVILTMLNKYKSLGWSMYQIFGGLAPPFQAQIA